MITFIHKLRNKVLKKFLITVHKEHIEHLSMKEKYKFGIFIKKYTAIENTF